MKILCIGDVVGKIGCEFLRSKLSNVKRYYGVDMVVCNGENSADGNGVTPSSADFLFDSGVDVITLGNHAFRRKEAFDYLDRIPYIIRPANYPEGTTPGAGFCVYDMGRVRIKVINLMGNTLMGNCLSNPFHTIDRLLSDNDCKITLVDFHAEATSEKLAMGYYLDGRVSALFGTHTHVQTSDCRVLENGTGYVTDLGMTGPRDSVLGVKPEISIEMFKTNLPARFDLKKSKCKLEGAVFDIDEANGKTKFAETVRII